MPTTLFRDLIMNRHRHTHQSRSASPGADITLKQALADMELDPDTFHTMISKKLTRHYRRLARKHHPDKGGEEKRFIALNRAYERLRAELK